LKEKGRKRERPPRRENHLRRRPKKVLLVQVWWPGKRKDESREGRVDRRGPAEEIFPISISRTYRSKEGPAKSEEDGPELRTSQRKGREKRIVERFRRHIGKKGFTIRKTECAGEKNLSIP